MGPIDDPSRPASSEQDRIVQHEVSESRAGESAAPEEASIERRGPRATITLNQPQARAARTADMRRKLAAAYPRFARDPQIYAVVIQSASERAFSVGADVRELTRLGREDREAARRAFAEEYALNW